MKKEYSFRHAEFNCEYRYPIIFHPIHNFKEWKAYRWRRKYLLQNGFSPEAFWDTDHWFVDVMLDILKKHYQWNDENLYSKNNENIQEFQKDITRMIELLEFKKEENESDIVVDSEFFKLFQKRLPYLWN